MSRYGDRTRALRHLILKAGTLAAYYMLPDNIGLSQSQADYARAAAHAARSLKNRGRCVRCERLAASDRLWSGEWYREMHFTEASGK